MKRPRTGGRRSIAPAFRRARSNPPGPLPRASPASPFDSIRRPLRRVLNRLHRDSPRIEQAWRKLLRDLKPIQADYDALAAMDLAASYRHLSLGGAAGSASGDEAYRLAIERGARTLIRSGVPEGHAIAAVALYFEACLASLDGRPDVRALIRLTSATQRQIADDYCEERVAGLRRLDDQERQKLSGDLHDEVGADLIVLKLYVEMIALELAKGGSAPVGPKLQEALTLIAHAVESVRRLTMDLGPAFLDSLGFLPALRGFVRQFSLRTRIKVEIEATNAPVSMPASHETALYRVLRGALSNVAKHSKARHATVTLCGRGDVFVMVVEDDGKGFDVRAQGPERCFGLTAMRERIHGLGGRFEIESRRAGRRGERSGTRIEVRVPLRKRTAA